MATSSVKKGTDPAGTAIATETISEDAETRHLQRVILADGANGMSVISSAVENSPVAINVPDDAVTTLLAANTARVGFRIIHSGATISVGHDPDQTLVNLQTHGLPLFATQPYEQYGPGLYRGEIVACCQDGEGPTTVFVVEW